METEKNYDRNWYDPNNIIFKNKLYVAIDILWHKQEMDK